MGMIKCEKFFGRNEIRSYQEFYLAMTIAAECGRRGKQLDLSGMKIRGPNLLSKDDLGYLKYLRETGAVYDGSLPDKHFIRGSSDDLECNRPVYWFDVDCITELEGTLFKETEDSYEWNYDWAYQSYGKKYQNSVTLFPKLGNTIMHLVGHMLVCFDEEDLPVKKLVFSFNRMESMNTFMYLSLYACICSCERIRNIVELRLPYGEKCLNDIDFYVMYDSAKNGGTFKLHSWATKKEAMEKNGIQEGSIVAMYRRERITANNPAGVIKEALIARVESLGNLPEMVVTTLAVNKTKEEQELGYLEIDEEYRYIFSDMLDFRIPQNVERHNLCNVGICEYLYTEDWLMLPLDRQDTVTKIITIDGNRVTQQMDTVEAVYWILNEYDIPFDHDLYRKMYNNGRGLMWDLVDGTPHLITDTLYE